MTRDEVLSLREGEIVFLRTRGGWEASLFKAAVFASGDIRSAIVVHEGTELYIPIQNLRIWRGSGQRLSVQTISKIIRAVDHGTI